MHEIVYLIERLATGLYFICAAGMLLSLRRLFLAHRRLAAAEFELERELTYDQQAGAITWSIILIEVALAVVAIAHVIAPTLRADALSNGSTTANTAISEVFITSTPGGNGQEIRNIDLTTTAQVKSGADLNILRTPLPSQTPVGTIVAGAPPITGCDTPDATLQIPANGQVLFDSVTVIGTANLKNYQFSSYKLELNGPSTGNQFAPVLQKNQSVRELGTLGLIPLNAYQPGQYAFRLAVFDTIGVLRASCVVNVQIRLPPATLTPSPTLPTATPTIAK